MVEIVKDIIIKRTDEIKPYFKNPRKNNATVEALMAIIPKVGFNVPILIDSDNVIIKGHARYAACKRLGIEEIPCIVSQNSEEQNKLDRLADNKISELSEWDISELNSELSELTVDIDLKSLGFELDNLIKENLTNVTEIAFPDKEKSLEEIAPEETEIKIHVEDLEPVQMGNENDTSILDQVSGSLDTKKFAKVKCPKCGEELEIEIN